MSWRSSAVLLLLTLALPLGAAGGQFTAADGATLHYTTLGSGKPVILLSGGPGFTVDYLMPVAREVARHAKAVLLEQRGTGHSTLAIYDATTITIAKNVEDIDALRMQLGVDKIALFGHSWGGMLAMAYAAAHPDHVERLVLLESGGPTLDFARPFSRRLDAALPPEALDALAYWRDPERRKANPRHATVESIRAKTPAYFYDQRQSRDFATHLTDDSYEPRVNNLLFGEMSKSYDLREPLRHLTAPVFIIQSRQDPLQATDDILAAIPHAKLLWIEKSGHFPWIEQPAAFHRAVTTVLR